MGSLSEPWGIALVWEGSVVLESGGEWQDYSEDEGEAALDKETLAVEIKVRR